MFLNDLRNNTSKVTTHFAYKSKNLFPQKTTINSYFDSYKMYLQNIKNIYADKQVSYTFIYFCKSKYLHKS